MERIIDNKNWTYSFERDWNILHTGKWGDWYIAPKSTVLNKWTNKESTVYENKKRNEPTKSKVWLSVLNPLSNLSNLPWYSNPLQKWPVAPSKSKKDISTSKTLQKPQTNDLNSLDLLDLSYKLNPTSQLGKINTTQKPWVTWGWFMPPTTSWQPAPTRPSFTPSIPNFAQQATTQFETWLRQQENQIFPKVSASESRPMNLFKDEQSAFDKMKQDNLDDQTAFNLIKQRRKDLMWGKSEISSEEWRALLKMQQDWLTTEEALKNLIEFRKQETPDNRPFWQKAWEWAIDFASWNLETLLKYGWNVLDIATLWKAWFWEDVKSMESQNKKLFKESTAFKVGKVMPDVAIATMPLWKAIKWMWLVKWWAVVWGGFWALQPILEKWSDVTVWDIATWAWVWALTWWVTWWVLKWIGKWYNALTKKLPASLQLSWMLNPAKLDSVTNKLIQEWEKAPENVAKWMIDRGIKWDKKTIISTLKDIAWKSKNAVDEVLKTITTKFKVESARKALKNIYDDIKNVSWQEELTASIKWLLTKRWWYTLSELNQIKRYMDDIYNIYKVSWEVSWWLKAQWLDNIRKSIKTFIEKEAEKAWLPNIKLLNNETAVANELARWIEKKDYADTVREFLSPFASRTAWWFIWSQTWPFDNSTPAWKVGNILLWAVVWWATQSTRVKTNVASFLSKLNTKEISVLDQYLISKWEKQLPKSLMQKLWWFFKSNTPLKKSETTKTKTKTKLKTGWFIDFSMNKKIKLTPEEIEYNKNLANKINWWLNKDDVNRQNLLRK